MNEKIRGAMAPKRYRGLLEKAAQEFAGAGFERASLNAIIRDCQISKSSFYHYFTSKEALFDAVVKEAATALGRALDAPDPATLAGPDFWDRIAAFVDHAATISAQQAWYIDVGKLFYLPDHSAERSPALRRVLAHVEDWLARTLASGRECGMVRQDLPVTLQTELVFAMLQAMDRWSLQQLHELDDEKARQKLAQSQLGSLQRLLAP